MTGSAEQVKRMPSRRRARPVRIETDNYVLETLTSEHAGTVEAWFETDRVRQGLGDVASAQLGAGRAARYLAGFDRERTFAFGVFTRSGALIGMYTVQIDPDNRVASVAVVIGDESSAGNGVGVETSLGMADWLFGPCALHKIFVRILSSNATTRNWMGSRLTLEGRLRQHVLLPTGERDDVLLYGLLREEWPKLRAWSVARATAKRSGGADAG